LGKSLGFAKEQQCGIATANGTLAERAFSAVSTTGSYCCEFRVRPAPIGRMFQRPAIKPDFLLETNETMAEMETLHTHSILIINGNATTDVVNKKLHNLIMDKRKIS